MKQKMKSPQNIFWENNQITRKKVNWLKQNEKPVINISDKVYNQIKFLCNKVSNREWSGILFYSITKGSIRNPNSLEIELKAIHLMDIGTMGSTNYSLSDGEFVNFIMDNEELEDCYMGHIHSHHNMDSYFSGTDNEELEDNVKNHNMYLSMIVNNKGKYIAKIVCNVLKTIIHDENGEKFEINNNALLEYNCIVKANEPVITDIDVAKRYEELLARNTRNITIGSSSNGINNSTNDYSFTSTGDKILKEAIYNVEGKIITTSAYLSSKNCPVYQINDEIADIIVDSKSISTITEGLLLAIEEELKRFTKNKNKIGIDNTTRLLQCLLESIHIDQVADESVRTVYGKVQNITVTIDNVIKNLLTDGDNKILSINYLVDSNYTAFYYIVSQHGIPNNNKILQANISNIKLFFHGVIENTLEHSPNIHKSMLSLITNEINGDYSITNEEKESQKKRIENILNMIFKDGNNNK